jgi:ferritin
MIPKKIHEAMNEQIKFELESSYLYLSMAGYFHAQGLDGMAQWMRVQVLEEMTHAMKFFDHLRDRGAPIKLLPLGMSKTEWSSPLEAFRDAYKHEQFITGRINELVKIAQSDNDNAAFTMLQWFVNEQVEEEANTSKIAQTLERIGDSGSGLILLDRELGARIFTPPPGTTILGGAGAA